MSDNEKFLLKFGFFIGVATFGLAAFLVSQTLESECQHIHNVADCEWSRTPFTPALPNEAPK